MTSKHALTFIFITVMVDMIGFGIIIPVMPTLIVELTGTSFGETARFGGRLMVMRSRRVRRFQDP